jgi:hypothetical protein
MMHWPEATVLIAVAVVTIRYPVFLGVIMAIALVMALAEMV